jgi:hypothetical protein
VSRAISRCEAPIPFTKSAHLILVTIDEVPVHDRLGDIPGPMVAVLLARYSGKPTRTRDGQVVTLRSDLR